MLKILWAAAWIDPPRRFMISRMRILSSPPIVACADKIMHGTIDTYFAPNKTIRELHDELVKSGSAFDPLKDFSEMAREELRTF